MEIELAPSVLAASKPAEKAVIKLDLGCGQHRQDGFLGVDVVKTECVDVVHDLLTFPWPFKDDSVSEVHCSHFFEHIPGKLRGKWMDELWRILVTGGKVTIIVPHNASERAFQDYTHEYPPPCGNSFYYFNKGWREVNKLTHGAYDIRCDFDFQTGPSLGPPWVNRADEARAFAVQHYNNVAMDLWVNLTKRSPDAGK